MGEEVLNHGRETLNHGWEEALYHGWEEALYHGGYVLPWCIYALPGTPR